MKDLNAVFQPEKISHAHGLQISYLQEERIRNLFVYHESGQVSESAISSFDLSVLNVMLGVQWKKNNVKQEKQSM